MEKKKKSSGPKKPAVVFLKKEKLVLTCDWADCKQVSHDIDDFVKHVKDVHLAERDSSNLNCAWQGCCFNAKSFLEFSTHVFFHTFHAKIKSIGSNILNRKGAICSLGTNGRNIIPELPDNFFCGWANCQEKFINPEYFYRHVDKHAENSAKGNNPKGGVVCLWEKCNINFQSQYKLRDHLHSHTQEKIVACPTCGGFFANRTKLLDHVKRQIPIEMQEYQCSHCSKLFSSERLLRDHMRTHVNHYKCPWCDMTCPSPSGLNTHIKYRHSDMKPFTCEYCEYSCKSQSDLRRHQETHTAEPTYRCCYTQCPFTTRNYQSIMNHIRKFHEGMKACIYKCHICDKNFNRGTYLTRHLMKQHKFRWPSGHSRFRYKSGSDGYYRLQTVRYESIELTQEIMMNEMSDVPDGEVSNVIDIVDEEAMNGQNILELPIDIEETPILISLEQNDDGTVLLQTVVQDKP